MTARLAGKSAVITGAASGIGEGTARRFIEEGAQVVIADLQQDKGSALAEELGESARYIFCDVTVEDDIAAAVDLAIAESSMLGIAGQPSDIANALLYLASEEACYVTGHALVVDAGQTTGGMVAGFHESEPDIIREAGNRGA